MNRGVKANSVEKPRPDQTDQYLRGHREKDISREMSRGEDRRGRIIAVSALFKCPIRRVAFKYSEKSSTISARLRTKNGNLSNCTQLMS